MESLRLWLRLSFGALSGSAKSELDTKIQSVLSSEAATLFLTSPNVLILRVLFSESQGSMFCTNGSWSAVSEPEQGMRSPGMTATFTKRVPCVVSDAQFHHCVGVTTSSEGQGLSLYEYEYWMSLSLSASSKQEKEAAVEYSTTLKRVAEEVSYLGDRSIESLADSIQIFYESLNSLWVDGKYSKQYPESRMVGLLQALSFAIVSVLQAKLDRSSLLDGDFSSVRQSVDDSVSVCDQWIKCTTELTGIMWPNSGHRWTGQRFSSPLVSALSQRLEEISRIRSLHEQLKTVLDSSDLKRESFGDMLTPLHSINVLHITVDLSTGILDSLDRFQKAKTDCLSKLAPLEQRIADRLSLRFSFVLSNPNQLIHEFLRFQKDVKKQLSVVERSSSRKDTAAAASLLGVKVGLSAVSEHLIWARQHVVKLRGFIEFGNSLLSDLSSYSGVRERLDGCLSDLTNFEESQFHDWIDAVRPAVSGKNALSGSLMEIDKKDGRLKVNYDEGLVNLIKEVRQLSSSGFQIPREIMGSVRNAEKLYRYGVILKQIANFYNTVDKQIVLSQKPMLLDVALAFEEVVKTRVSSSKTASGTWDDAEATAKYVSRLQAASQQFVQENRKLRKYHMEICQGLSWLLDLDLVRQQGKWKEKLDELRSVIENLERSGYKNMQMWKLHLDRQLYKVLDYQYVLGLNALNVILPETKVEFVLKDGSVVFRPSLESLRDKYYSRLKDYVRLPTRFKGFCGNVTLFSEIVDRNAGLLIKVYEKAESLFSKLERVSEPFGAFLVLTSVPDSLDFVVDNLSSVEDFEYNFKLIKQKGKDLEKLENGCRVECFAVSFVSLKRDIESHLSVFADSVVSGLRKKALVHVEKIAKFLQSAKDAVSQKPQTLEEIGQANMQFRKLSEDRTQFLKEFDEFELKNRLLKQVSGEELDVSQYRVQWEKFSDMVLAHELMIKEQTDALKTGVLSRIQAFESEIAKFASKFQQSKPKDVRISNRSGAAEALGFVKDRRKELVVLMNRSKELAKEAEYFGCAVPTFDDLFDVDADLSGLETSWGLFDSYLSAFSSIWDEDWVTFRKNMFKLEDFASKQLDLLKKMTQDRIAGQIRDELASFRPLYGLLPFLRGDGWEKDHWFRLFSILNIPRSVSVEDLKVSHFLERIDTVVAQQQAIKELHARAQGEVMIREALLEIKTWGSSAVLTMIVVGDATRKTPLVKEWKDVLMQIGDHQSLLATLKESLYFSLFADEIGSLEVKLVTVDRCLQILNPVQRKWLYLEPIFSRGSLPEEQGRFNNLDSEFREIMTDIASDPLVLTLSRLPDLEGRLKGILDNLERCQKALNDFLEQKRNKFPRFYFIGDDDLLEILGQANNPAVIQNHLKKLFAGIHSVVFDPSSTTILAVRSVDGEQVQIIRPIQVDLVVESWMSALDTVMKQSLQQLQTSCLNGPQFMELGKYPSQVLDLVCNIRFTADAESAIRSRTLDKFESQVRAFLNELTSQDTSADNVLDLKVKSLVLTVIHQLDVVRQLNRSGTRSTEDWQWQKQLRFYADSNVGCVVKMCDAVFPYTYEYQGNAPKLVHTPLTDKCYLTLTQGMWLGFGGNPYGPAGTGKTESVKALGQALARQVLVFNCDEGIDFQSMGRIFIGLVKCGAWGCFDEFNRLKEDQLSAISQQIQVIQAAIKDKQPEVELLSQTISVNFNAGIFVTLNPAGKGYGGRSKLPDNLKQLFRSVAMTSPDNDVIAEVILYSEGMRHAESLGTKLVSVFRLSKQLLSQQQHYDWGLRALKTVLRMAGSLIRFSSVDTKTRSVEDEAEILVKALRANTLPKLTFADAIRFDGIVRDLFPNIRCVDLSDELLDKAIREALTRRGYRPIDSQVLKILQLNETIRQRMGVVLVGPTGSGKSTLWSILHEALNSVGRQVKLHTLNPKAMPRNQLLGHMDMDTREWFDGVLTASARTVVKESLDVTSWIVCDGDIDPEWVESLNSVLDDNRLLTMPSGERIQFGPNVNFVFECDHLRYASPATVSRMGMIFLSDEDMPVGALVDSWFSFLGDKEFFAKNKDFLSKVFPQMLLPAVDFFFSRAGGTSKDIEVRATVIPSKYCVLRNIFSQLEFAMASVPMSSMTMEEFCVCILRGLGPFFADSISLTSFSKFLFDRASIRSPDSATYYSVDFDRKTMQICSLASIPFSGDSASKSLFVKTANVQRVMKVLEPWLSSTGGGKSNLPPPVLLVGPEGCGKSLVLENALSVLRGAALSVIHCTAQTSASQLIQKLLQTCVFATTTRGRVLRPKEGKLVLFLKDINLPKPDQYGTAQLVAFLQQLIHYCGFWDHNLEWIGLEKIQIVASMNPVTSSGRYAVSPRLLSTFHVCSLLDPDAKDMELISSAVLGKSLGLLLSSSSKAGKTVVVRPPKPFVDKLASWMVKVYFAVRDRLSSEVHPHYVFSPRIISAWAEGFARYRAGLSAELEEKKSVDESEIVARLLQAAIYEGERLFKDKLSLDDVDKFSSFVARTVRETFSADGAVNPDYVYSSCAGSAVASYDEDSEESETSQSLNASSRFLPLSRISISEYRAFVADVLKIVKREVKPLDVLLIDEFLLRVARIERVLSNPSEGSLLLCGPAGCGRRSAVCLVSHMLRLSVMTPHVTSSYGMREFKLDLKSVLSKASVDGERILFLLEEHQIVDEGMLELINALLSAGEIPGLYSKEEFDALLQSFSNSSAFAAFSSSSAFPSVTASLHSIFVACIKRNVRVVIVLDPLHEKYVSRCLSNPALFSRCSVQYVEGWGKDSLRSFVDHRVASAIGKRQDAAKEPRSSKDVLNTLSTAFLGLIRTAAEQLTVQPADVFHLLSTYEAVFHDKKSLLESQLARLLAGLNKLKDAASTVDELAKDAIKKKKELEEKQKEADTALQDISSAMETASKEKSAAEKLRVRLEKDEQVISKNKKDMEAQLAEVMPMVEAAKSSVSSISSSQLAEIGSMAMPPPAVRDVLEAVLRLMGIQDTSWNAMRKFLKMKGVKDQILSYDASSIEKSTRDAVRAVFQANSSSFEPSTIERVSRAAAPLASWVRALIDYSYVLEEISPLTDNLKRLESSLADSQDQLKSTEERVGAIDKKVDSLRRQFAQKTSDAENLRIGLQKAQDTLDAARNLLNKLGGERGRWEEEADSLRSKVDRLPVRAIVASGFLALLPACSEDVRGDMVKLWMSVVEPEPNQSSFSGKDLVQNFLTSESELLQWKSEGLPADSLSRENAMAVVFSGSSNDRRVPLILDPSTRAVAWLKAHLSLEKGATVDIVRYGQPRWSTQLELAVRFGKTLVLEELDRVDPLLIPLLRRDFLSSPGASSSESTTAGVASNVSKRTVWIGDKNIEYHPNFRLFLACRALPSLSPSLQRCVSVVNFSVSRSGLEAQLLGIALEHEKPELETQRAGLLQKEESLRRQLHELEESLLVELAQAQGNLLENRSLIDRLNDIKEAAGTVKASLEESARIQLSVEAQRDVYRLFARSSSSIYFVTQDLSRLSHMYRFSLESFISLFKEALHVASSSDSVDARISMLVHEVVFRVSQLVGTSLFQEHRLVFLLHLARSLHGEAFVSHEEWLFWLTSSMQSGSPELSSSITSGAASSLPRELEGRVPRDRVPAVVDLLSKFPSCMKAVVDACSSSSGIQSPGSSTPFSRVLAEAAVRPDRALTVLENAVTSVLGLPALADFCSLSLDSLIEGDAAGGKGHARAFLIMMSPGADPSRDIEDICFRTIKSAPVSIAMGQGQTVEALRLLKRAVLDGQWLFLKNLHLVTPWLPVLEKELLSLLDSDRLPEKSDGKHTQRVHPAFRLFLSTESHDSIPPVFLTLVRKVAYEAPPGLRANLRRTLESWETDSTVPWPASVPRRAQIRFTLAFLQGLLQERRTYIPQGWLRFYEFGTADLRAATDVLENRSSSPGGIDWKTIHGLFSSAVYGGRIDTPQDMRVLHAYLHSLFPVSSDAKSSSSFLLKGQLSAGPSTGSSISDYLRMVEDAVPAVDSPSVFGLAANANRVVNINRAVNVVAGLKVLVQGSISHEGKSSGHSSSKVLEPLIPILKQFMQTSSTALAAPPGKTAVDLSPLSSFIESEYKFSRDLLQRVFERVSAVLSSLSPLTTTTAQSSRTSNTKNDVLSLCSGNIPESWTLGWEDGPVGSPAAWLSLIVTRTQTFSKLHTAGAKSFVDIPFESVFHSEALLSALRQATARKLGCALDALSFSTSFSSFDNSYPLSSLWIQGAIIDHGSIADCSSDSPAVVKVPETVHVGWVVANSAAANANDPSYVTSSDGRVVIPLFANPSREHLLAELELPCENSRSRWILSGAAFFARS
eukprot:ANDGO_02875.mRNA.1 Cytoplasmic dynein 2 heavy chain 1